MSNNYAITDWLDNLPTLVQATTTCQIYRKQILICKIYNKTNYCLINFANYNPLVVIYSTRHYFQVFQRMRDCYFFCLRISHARFVNPAVSVQTVCCDSFRHAGALANNCQDFIFKYLPQHVPGIQPTLHPLDKSLNLINVFGN